MTEQQILNFRMRGQGIPHYMVGGVLRYFNDHIEPGDFLVALLENNFMEACGMADENNLPALAAWAGLLYNLAPRGSYGSPEKVKAWLAMRDIEQEQS